MTLQNFMLACHLYKIDEAPADLDDLDLHINQFCKAAKALKRGLKRKGNLVKELYPVISKINEKICDTEVPKAKSIESQILC